VDLAHVKNTISSEFMTDFVEGRVLDELKRVAMGVQATHYYCGFEDVAMKRRTTTDQRGYYFSQAAGVDPEKVVSVLRFDVIVSNRNHSGAP
jgi:hypothetical protein